MLKVTIENMETGATKEFNGDVVSVIAVLNKGDGKLDQTLYVDGNGYYTPQLIEGMEQLEVEIKKQFIQRNAAELLELLSALGGDEDCPN